MKCSFQTKLAILEQKLLKEEHERKLVQEKADEVSECTRTLHFLDQLSNYTIIHIFTFLFLPPCTYYTINAEKPFAFTSY